MKISVIIPVYNREQVVSTCVEGILNTQFTDFEVLLIDDGSSDNSLSVCQKLSQKYDNVKVISQQNRGVSAARNNGIRNASGDYILFSDSDDTFFPNALYEISKLLIHECDLLMFGLSNAHYSNDGIRFRKDTISSVIKNIKGNKEIIDWLFTDYNPYINPIYSVCVKAFRRDILIKNNINFREDLSLGEDQVFTCTYLKYVMTFCFSNIPYYYVISWPKSMRSWGLGTVFRTPDDFLYNQIINYKTLIDLYDSSKVLAVKKYAVNYILDRPISRIVFKNTIIFNANRKNYSVLRQYVIEKIKPVLSWEYENLSMLRDKKIKKCVSWIMNDKLYKLLFYSYFTQNLFYLKCRVFEKLSSIKKKILV